MSHSYCQSMADCNKNRQQVERHSGFHCRTSTRIPIPRQNKCILEPDMRPGSYRSLCLQLLMVPLIHQACVKLNCCLDSNQWNANQSKPGLHSAALDEQRQWMAECSIQRWQCQLSSSEIEPWWSKLHRSNKTSG